MGEVNCVHLINNFNKKAREYHLSALARSIFMLLWERNNLNHWKLWFVYTDTQLQGELKGFTRDQIYRAKMKLVEAGLVKMTHENSAHKTPTNSTKNTQETHTKRATLWSLQNLEPQGLEPTSETENTQETHTISTQSVQEAQQNPRPNKNKTKLNNINNNKAPSKDGAADEKEIVKKPGEVFAEMVASKEILEALNAYADMRKKKRNALTAYAATLLVNKLNKLSQDEGEQLEMINNAIQGGWSSVYPLDKGGSNGKVQRNMAGSQGGKGRRRYEYESEDRIQELLDAWNDE